jgi:hypothetical protein
MSFRSRFKNWKLRARRRRLEKQFNATSKQAKRKADHRIVDGWYNINGWKFDSIDAEIKHNDSRAMLDEAENFYLPTPGLNDKDKWTPKAELNSFENWCVLTPEAMTELRSVLAGRLLLLLIR